MKKAVKITLLCLLVVMSVTTWYFSYRSGLAIIYNDAMSHLNIARAVIDNKQPGIAQLGSVWLPLNHILFLTLIWNTWAWHSGFAGSFFSMLAYIFGAIGIYKIIDELTDNFIASVIGASAFALNLNMLYLQTTPLTEPLYLVFFIFSVLFLVKFIKTDDLRYLLLMGIFGMLQVLTRYDGWFVVLIEGLLLIYQQRFIRKISFQDIIGKFLLFAIPIAFGATLWFLWNGLIFGDPLYFMFGPYSAHAQQVVIQSSVGLITKGNLRVSILAYWYAVSDNIGNYLIALASLSIILFFAIKSKIVDLKSKSVIFLILLAPILFNVIALYLGFSILNLPELHWDPSGDPSQQWFNVRYGIMALPFVAVFIGLLAEKFKKKWLALLILLVVVTQAFATYQQGIITITDGTMGSSNSTAYNNVASILSENVTPGENILISTASYSAVIFKSGFPIKDFITEGDSSEWKNALAEPQNYADWVVMGNGDLNDSVYAAILKNNSQEFLKNYILFYCNAKICAYEKRTPAETFVSADGTNLKVGDTNFVMKGVNSYDLAYKPTSTIDATFKNLSSIGVNTVRFWMFGDGNPDGFQISGGIMNEARLENTDYLIADAAKYDIRLIPVLLNNWTDYGGEQQYLKWIGQDPSNQDAFYTNPEAIALFKNYINHVIPRTNTINGIDYSDDPTILAWEIVNEPRFSASDTQAFVNWFSNVAGYIRQEDPNHMITVETDQTSVSQDGQLSISDYCSELPVDLCSAHLYLYDNTTPIYSSLSAVQANILRYSEITASDDKPFFLGEVGISKTTSPFGESPLDVLKNIVGSNKNSGTLIWNWSDQPDTSYGFSPKGTNGEYTLVDLSTVLGGIQPSTVYFAETNPSQGGYDVSFPGMGPPPAPTSTTPAQPVTQPATTTISSVSPTVATIIAASTTIATTTAPIPTNTPPALAVIPEKALPYSTDQFSAADWVDGWGMSSVTNGVLTVGGDANDTSGGIFLSGSDSWKDYLITANVDWIKGQLLALVARRTDNNNYLECDFSTTGEDSIYVNMYRVFNNETESISDEGTISQNQNNISTSSMEVSMRVSGDTVQCGINNAIVQNDINLGDEQVLEQGGIGFKTWDPTPNNSEIIVKNLSVDLLP